MTSHRVDARQLLKDANGVLLYLRKLPADSAKVDKFWPTPFLFRSFFDCVECLAAHLRPISLNRPEHERGPAVLDGIAESDREEFISWAQSLESRLRETCLEHFGTRFYFSTQGDSGERVIHFEHRNLRAFSESTSGIPGADVADIAKLPTADVDSIAEYVDQLAEIISRKSGQKGQGIDSSTQKTAHQTAHGQAEKCALTQENEPQKENVRTFDRQCKTLLNRWLKRLAEEKCKGMKPTGMKPFFTEALSVLRTESPGTWNNETSKHWKAKRFIDKFNDPGNWHLWCPQVGEFIERYKEKSAH